MQGLVQILFSNNFPLDCFCISGKTVRRGSKSWWKKMSLLHREPSDSDCGNYHQLLDNIQLGQKQSWIPGPRTALSWWVILDVSLFSQHRNNLILLVAFIIILYKCILLSGLKWSPLNIITVFRTMIMWLWFRMIGLVETKQTGNHLNLFKPYFYLWSTV